MKKILVITIALALLGLGSVFAQAKADGVYFAQGSTFDAQGWKDAVTVTVKGGKITAVTWDATSNLGVAGKKDYSAAGKYGMEKTAKKGAWHVQAKAVEDFIVKNQTVASLKIDAKQIPDATTGATMKVDGFAATFTKALESKPVAKGSYKKDGIFFAEEAAFQDSGWKDNALVVIANGTIVDVLWNGVSKTAKSKSKLVTSETGKYGMKGKQGDWHVQTAKVSTQVLKDQDAKADAVTGASITISGFMGLVKEAVKTAR